MSTESCPERLSPVITWRIGVICSVLVYFRLVLFCHSFTCLYVHIFILIRCFFHLEVEWFPTTPININRLEQELTEHSDRPFVGFLLSGLPQGFHAGIQRVPVATLQGENLRSARNNPTVVSILLTEELRNGFLIGPFDVPPLRVYRIFPLGLVFGKDSNNLVLFSIYHGLMTMQILLLSMI